MPHPLPIGVQVARLHAVYTGRIFGEKPADLPMMDLHYLLMIIGILALIAFVIWLWLS